MSDTNQYKLDNAVTDDFDLDDIESLPKFVKLPTGSYILQSEDGITVKKINEGKPEEFDAYELKGTILEVAETTDLLENEAPPKAGDEASWLWNRTNKMSMDQFKDVITPFKNHYFPGQTGVTVGMCREKTKDAIFSVIVKRTFGTDKETKKKDYDKVYSNITMLTVA